MGVNFFSAIGLVYSYFLVLVDVACLLVMLLLFCLVFILLSVYNYLKHLADWVMHIGVAGPIPFDDQLQLLLAIKDGTINIGYSCLGIVQVRDAFPVGYHGNGFFCFSVSGRLSSV